MLDNITKNKLSSYFASKPIEIVYLFGSQTEGKTKPDSDIDLAVLFKKDLSEKDRSKLLIEMIADLESIMTVIKVDLIDLAKANLPLQHSAIFQRYEILNKNNKRRVLFEAEVFSRYFDYSYFINQNTSIGLPSISRMKI